MSEIEEITQALKTLSQILISKQWKLAPAESCTGGWVAKLCTDLPGSSEWFDRGFITYSNESKIEMLGVKESTLQNHGAVSEQTTYEMATGAIAHSNATVALSISGIAGPGGGTAEKPVGTICFGWAIKDGEVRTTTYRFDGDREAVRLQAVRVALVGVVDIVKSN